MPFPPRSAPRAAAPLLALALLVAAPAAATDPDLLVHLRLDDASGAVATDAAGGDDDGAVVSGTGGPEWTTGRVGGGLRFGGLTASRTRYVRVPWRVDLATTRLTVMAWVNASEFRNQLHCIVGRYTGDTWDWRLWVNKHGNHLNFKIGTTTGWQEIQQPLGPHSLDPGEWHHVAATWDGATQRLYLDGSQIASRVGSGTLQCKNTTQPLGVGAKSDGSNWADSFYGTIDDLKIWKRALTQAEIQAEMSEGAGFRRLRWQERF